MKDMLIEQWFQRVTLINPLFRAEAKPIHVIKTRVEVHIVGEDS